MRQQRPLIAITMGDPAGVGPEVCVLAHSTGRLTRWCRPVVVGDGGVLRRAMAVAGVKLPLRLLPDGRLTEAEGRGLNLLDLANVDQASFSFGKMTRDSGKASIEYLLKGIEMAIKMDVEALVTCPISKEAIHMAGFKYEGHTEILAERTNTVEYRMVLVAGALRAVHNSAHVSLREACSLVKKDRVLKTIEYAHRAARELGITGPRVAVAGLNPHAGEAGLLGSEEVEEIAPAIEKARQLGFHCVGPISPDTVFLRASRGEFDMVVAMYHDQGHIPLKLAGFERAVQWTVGLPFVRTSVAHGTGFDIAGKGICSPKSLIEAIKLAAAMAAIKRGQPKKTSAIL